MRISALIDELQRIQETYGNLYVTARDEHGNDSSVYRDDLYVYHKASEGAHTVSIDPSRG